ADRNRSHWSTSKTPSYTKSVSWQHHRRAERVGCVAGWTSLCRVLPLF
ncbi:transposase, partial [Klebsiella variicola]